MGENATGDTTISYRLPFLNALVEEVSLELRSRNDLLTAATKNGAMLTVADCWPLNREEMVMLLDISGPLISVKNTIRTLREMAGVKEVIEEESNARSNRVFMALEKPRICGSASNSGVTCLDCPFNSTELPARWRFTERKPSDAGEIVARLATGGIQATSRLLIGAVAESLKTAGRTV